MRTLFGAVAGALAVGAMLVSYDLGERRAFGSDMTPPMQMVMGPDGIARPYLIQTGQTANGWSPYASPYGTMTPPAAYATYPAVPQYVNERVIAPQPVVRRVSSQRTVVAESKPARSWQKTALLIGGSAGAGAGIGAIAGGKKGALIGAAIGGGSAALYDQIKRR